MSVSLPHFTLGDNVRPGVGPEGVVERDEDHGVGVNSLLGYHPLRAVLGVDANHGVTAG